MTLMALMAAPAGAAAPPGAGPEQRRPNVIIVVADDLGYADLGCQGISRDVKTPYIDSLAAGGVRFTNGYVSGALCSPTRAGLLTGRYQQRFGFEYNDGPQARDKFGLPVDQVTLAQTLKDAGYVTGMAGKWHLGNRPEMHPTRRGFDTFLGFLGGAHPYNAVGQGPNAVQRGTAPVEKVDYLTDAFTREAVTFIDRQATAHKPFFFYLAYNAVHTPMQAPPRYLDRFATVADPKRRSLLAMLSALDDGVGQVLGRLRAHGIEENTLIFFLSDNGAPTQGNGSLNTPLRGVKNTLWEGGVRAPILVQWKGTLPAGKVYDKPVIQLDIMPTVLAAARVPAPKDVSLDGVDLVPFLTGSKNAVATTSASAPHEALYWRYDEQWAIRSGDYKLTRADTTRPPMLFDLSKDPGESTDVAARQPETVQKLQAKYDLWSKSLPAPRWRDLPEARAGARRARELAP
jgi:arylsulfatase A-like enzyme